MKKLLELRQEKSALKSAMRSLLEKADAEKRSLTAEESKQFDEHRARAESLDKDIFRLEAVAEEERRQPGQPAEGKTLTSDELRTWIMTGETRALSTAEGADGGYTVIPELDKEIMRRVMDDSVMRAISTVKTTKSNAYRNWSQPVGRR
ncbi:HK97 family phage major capsid protein [Pantoea alhagi]|nr:HK97 family phage major capsid protein [Pantoea alhagi]